MSVYKKAILHTLKRAEIEEDANWKKYYETLNGVHVYVLDYIDNNFGLCGVVDSLDIGKMKDAIYFAEQDELIGMYNNERNKFNDDWENGEYCPCGVLVFEADCVEVLCDE